MSTMSNARLIGGVAAVAAAGSAQADAGALTGAINVVSAADDAKGVVLPTSLAESDVVVVVNTVSNKVLKVYPPLAGAINGGSANAAVSLRAAQAGVFFSLGGGDFAAVYDTDTTGT